MRKKISIFVSTIAMKDSLKFALFRLLFSRQGSRTVEADRAKCYFVGFTLKEKKTFFMDGLK